MLTFRSNVIPGFHGEVLAEAPEVPTKNRYAWGLKGNVLIIGRQAKRTITCEIWLNEPNWIAIADFYDGLRQLEDTVGLFGVLTVGTDTLYGVWDAPAVQDFENCFFAGYENLPFRGQRIPSPVQDEAGCLYAVSSDPDVVGNKSWAQRMRLNWTQTVPDRTVIG